ncbi:MAG: tRNA (adenosine(37)-N6)-threonylcarbamoyltransferase complex ATPase subunit type 1 TsaE [Bdellovibrionaceae bacterium]|nr:tRNA (adenosine(37)-N6)-threonylcarbamoyltransferase complex ATPase subunit type 1 TsaE [Pseudobdellovibrionaceae bacterium]
MKDFTRHLTQVSDLSAFVEELLLYREPRTLWLLEGEVGSGKTETVKALSRLWGLSEVASPSYAIHHRYENRHGVAVDHLDLYRLESEEDLESTGFWDLFSESEGLVVIEWADRLNWDYLPRGWSAFHLKYEKGPGPTERRIQVQKIR